MLQEHFYISFGQAIAKPNRVVILEGINAEKITAKDKKIKELEQENKKLKEQLEVLRGKLYEKM